MTHNLYQVGGTLINDAPSYVERRADASLYDALKQGDFCYVLNSRQMGKSSLLVRTKSRLQQEGFRCTTIDMTNVGSEHITPTQWYKGIVGELWSGFKLMKQLNLKTWWQQQDDISPLQKLSHFITELLTLFPDERLFIFIDEIDSVLSLDFSVDDFWAFIRFCYNQRSIDPNYQRITFAIFGVATPSDLIQDRNRTPFNIGKAIKLDGFQLHEAVPLASGLTLQEGDAQEVLKSILDWTGGQPFLTQKLCQLVVSASQGAVNVPLTIPRGAEAFWVRNLVESHIIQGWESLDEPEHLRTIRDRLLRNEQRAGRILGVYQRILLSSSAGLELRKQDALSASPPTCSPVPLDDSREQTELLLSGLVIKDQGYLRVKNRIYASVFNLKWVESQLAALRPYAQTLDAWLMSDRQDTSRLLRGQTLIDAQQWSQGKSLGDLDYQFLSASQELNRHEMQLLLEGERAKEITARLAAEQKRIAYQKKANLVLASLLTGMTLKFGIMLWLWLSTLSQYRTLLTHSCTWMQASGQANPAISEADRQLCKGVGTEEESQQAEIRTQKFD